MTEGTAGEVEARLRCKSGEYRWVRLVGKPVFEDGRAVRLVGHVRDVHERKVAELALLDSERMFRALFEETSIAVTVRDADTQKFLDCNPAALRLYGFESAGGASRHDARCACTSHTAGRPCFRRAPPRIRSAGRCATAWRGWNGSRSRRNGESFPAEIHTTVIARGRAPVMQTSIEDVTERNQNVRELEQRARRDDLVSRVSRQFVQADRDVALPFALEALGTFFGADRVRMRCFFDSGATLVTLAGMARAGHPSVPPSARMTPRVRSFATSPSAWRTTATSRSDDMNALHGPSTFCRARPDRRRRARSSFSPVTNQGALIGWIVIEHVDKKRHWSEDDISTARLVTEIIAMARARAEAEEKTQRRAAHDELLSEVSRRFLDEDPEADRPTSPSSGSERASTRRA